MKIAVLFDGAGLARLGLEQAGHECVGIEIDPIKAYLGSFVGSGNSLVKDAKTFDTTEFDAVWASPPCQNRSRARTQGPANRVGLHSLGYSAILSEDLVDWSLALPNRILWVENVVVEGEPDFGIRYNAFQFLKDPIQQRNRQIGGRFKEPEVFRNYSRMFKGICPCITATEYRGCATDKRRASRFYGRKLTLEECAFHQGFNIPDGWRIPPPWYTGTKTQWLWHQYEAVGNGVPVYMARAFGEAEK